MQKFFLGCGKTYLYAWASAGGRAKRAFGYPWKLRLTTNNYCKI